MNGAVEISCESETMAPTRRIVRLKSANFLRQALMFEIHSARQAVRDAGATPVDWRFTPTDAEELAIELGLDPDVDLSHCTLDDLPISIREDAAGSGLRAVRGPEILRFPLKSVGTAIRIL